MKPSIVLCLAFAVAPALAACDRIEERSRTHVTSAEVPSPPVDPASIDAIAGARCDREAHCDDIGEGKKYSNRDACLSDVQSSKDDSLTRSSCPGGIDKERLEGCLSTIRTERCENPLDTVARLTACRTSALCDGQRATPPPPAR